LRNEKGGGGDVGTNPGEKSWELREAWELFRKGGGKGEDTTKKIGELVQKGAFRKGVCSKKCIGKKEKRNP